ncbi:MAG TPA: hypothetical protein DDX98_00890 [Bacteroidales bacterium]|nr:hypothetical protein [Bacteroidales bacterium]
MKRIILLFSISILFAACHKSSTENGLYLASVASEEMMEMTPPASRPVATPAKKIENKEVDKKKIIKDGRMGISVDNIENAKSNVDTLLKTLDGYYARENFSSSDYESSFYLKIRIPATNFEPFISGIEKGENKVIYKEIQARDVTDEFIDLETRLANKRNYLSQYNRLLNRASTIKEILEIQEKIRPLEEEIESTVGRLNYLNDQVAYSSLDLTITKEKEFTYNPKKRDKFLERLKQSLSRGWFAFIDFVLFILKLWPFAIIAIAVVWTWKRFRKKAKK